MLIGKKARSTALIAVFVLALLALAACGRSSDPTATPTVPPTVPPTEVPVEVEVEVATPTAMVVGAAETDEEAGVIVFEDPWERIQATGKMIVGTSADYAPFESYDDDFQIVGFDPALLDAIAVNMGVEVELKDFAFDGLGAALQVGQIDAAIAAISVTEEREQQVDFSHVYYVSQDAVLAGHERRSSSHWLLERSGQFAHRRPERIGLRRPAE